MAESMQPLPVILDIMDTPLRMIYAVLSFATISIAPVMATTAPHFLEKSFANAAMLSMFCSVTASAMSASTPLVVHKGGVCSERRSTGADGVKHNGVAK